MKQVFLILFVGFVILFSGCTSDENNNAADSRIAAIPEIQGDWWRICETPDLGDLNGPDPDRQHVIDHGFIQAENGRWQLWACMRGTAIGRLLYRWEGESLDEGPWKPIGIAARADSSWGEQVIPQEKIQAPYFMKIDDMYYCFYNTNGARIMRSENGTDYERFNLKNGSNQMYAESGRDLMLLQKDDQFFSYSTVSTVARDGWKYGFIILRTSQDLKRWSDYTIVSSGGIAGNGPVSAESPFVIKVDGYYYLFRSSSITAKVYVYRSDTPYDFGVNNDSKLITTFSIKAPEIISYNGEYYISDLADFQGIKLAKLRWTPVD